MNDLSVRWLLCVVVMVAGCGDGGAAKGGSSGSATSKPSSAGEASGTGAASAPSASPSASASASSADPDRRLVGQWKFRDADEPRFTFNGKGRVRLKLGTMTCLGSWTTASGRLAITYEGGQKGCDPFGPPVGYSLQDGDATLTFVGATYSRVDAKDDASL